MRSLVVLLLVLTCKFSCLQAQPFHGGVLAGFSATQVDGDSYGGYNKAGLTGGVFVNTPLSGHFNIQLEIKYTGKGAKKPVTSESPQVYSLSLHYIDMPLIVNAEIKQFATVELGIMPAYLFASSGKDDGGKLPSDFLVTFRKFDFLFLTGLNINVLEKLTLNLRYSYSLTSIRNIESTGNYYSWFGKLLGRKLGDYNNCLTAALYFRIR